VRSLVPRRSTVAAAAALALTLIGVSAAQASAAQTITLATPCVVATSPADDTMTVTGAGFTAGDTVDLASNVGNAFGTTTVGPAGTFTASVTDPDLDENGPVVQDFTLTATDQEVAADTAATTFESAPFAVWTVPAVSKPTKKVTWNFSGFPTGDQVYVHFVHAGSVKLTADFGTASGPCGLLAAKAKLYPGKRAKYRHYTVQVDDSATYSTTTTPVIVTSLNFHVF
jgi:hypothetical protein